VRRSLQILALTVALASSAVWIAAGANRGWTKTSVPVKTVDDVTGIEGIEYRKHFVPGLDFLGAMTLGTGILAGVSFFFRKDNKPPKQH
jgi:hypothetical protein